ncbi:alpha/beta hydrolase [Amycolatopsis rhizosphaerae]|uniref:Alpha/beta hydrolase n=1 Tax=Amycolatopsis rhizosphaerae TaxID=2053003 RepID=A0A558DJI4_9PSEU|nr:alpha/beta hydrolase [Amycolatopsis rhizosphaerae]
MLSRSAREADETLRYGEGSEHVIELWRPGNGPVTRTVVVVHGGFWAAEYDRTHIRPLCAELARQGYLTAALEYHRVGQPLGGWPGTFTDVADGLDALPALTGGLVDGANTVLLGHSAGGHLALWAASRHRLPPGSPCHGGEPLRVRGVVSLAGVCDLEAAYRLNLDDGAVRRLLGGGPAQVPDRYRDADPAGLLPLGARCVLLHGDEDDRVPFDISRLYYHVAAGQGDDVTLERLDGMGHFELIDPGAPAFRAVLGAIDAVFAPEWAAR